VSAFDAQGNVYPVLGSIRDVLVGPRRRGSENRR